MKTKIWSFVFSLNEGGGLGCEVFTSEKACDAFVRRSMAATARAMGDKHLAEEIETCEELRFLSLLDGWFEYTGGKEELFIQTSFLDPS